MLSISNNRFCLRLGLFNCFQNCSEATLLPPLLGSKAVRSNLPFLDTKSIQSIDSEDSE